MLHNTTEELERYKELVRDLKGHSLSDTSLTSKEPKVGFREQGKVDEDNSEDSTGTSTPTNFQLQHEQYRPSHHHQPQVHQRGKRDSSGGSGNTKLKRSPVREKELMESSPTTTSAGDIIPGEKVQLLEGKPPKPKKLDRKKRDPHHRVSSTSTQPGGGEDTNGEEGGSGGAGDLDRDDVAYVGDDDSLSVLSYDSKGKRREHHRTKTRTQHQPPPRKRSRSKERRNSRSPRGQVGAHDSHRRTSSPKSRGHYNQQQLEDNEVEVSESGPGGCVRLVTCACCWSGSRTRTDSLDDMVLREAGD